MRFALGVASFLIASVAFPALAADPPAAIDATGRPAAYSKPVKQATYYLWHEDGAWHLRTRTKEKSREFSGLIRVQGGTVTRLDANAKGLEVRGKKKAKRDIGVVRDGGKTIAFEFRTDGGEDGFDFTVSPATTALDFQRRLMGCDHPDHIVIGRNGVSPPKARFTLPANPEAAAAD